MTGEVGDANPVYATEVLRNRGEQFDEILVSTLPRGASRWLLGDVPRKIGTGLPGRLRRPRRRRAGDRHRVAGRAVTSYVGVVPRSSTAHDDDRRGDEGERDEDVEPVVVGGDDDRDAS